MGQTFLDQLTVQWNQNKFVCVGLDKADFEFNKKIIDDTHDLVCAYKLNSAFYEAAGSKGLGREVSLLSFILRYPWIDSFLLPDISCRGRR